MISVMFFLRDLCTQKVYRIRYNKVYGFICCYIDSAVFHSHRLHEQVTYICSDTKHPASIHGLVPTDVTNKIH